MTVNAGRGVLAVVPDQRDVDALSDAGVRHVDESRVVALSAGLGPAQRYRRWLAVLRGGARLVIGTRSAVFAPVHNLGLVIVWDDGDDTLAEPRAPYPHAREVADAAGTPVAVRRGHRRVCADRRGAGAGARRLGPRPGGGPARGAQPRTARGGTRRSGYAQERDPAARTARLPSVALRAARAALEAGRPVLVQVPRRGYVPSLACDRCRTIARCRHCTGPLSLPDRDAAGAVCRWCGRDEPDAALCPLRLRGGACGRRRRRGAPPRSWAGRFPAPRWSRPSARPW